MIKKINNMKITEMLGWALLMPLIALSIVGMGWIYADAGWNLVYVGWSAVTVTLFACGLCLLLKPKKK